MQHRHNHRRNHQDMHPDQQHRGRNRTRQIRIDQQHHPHEHRSAHLADRCPTMTPVAHPNRHPDRRVQCHHLEQRMVQRRCLTFVRPSGVYSNAGRLVSLRRQEAEDPREEQDDQFQRLSMLRAPLFGMHGAEAPLTPLPCIRIVLTTASLPGVVGALLRSRHNARRTRNSWNASFPGLCPEPGASPQSQRRPARPGGEPGARATALTSSR
jgi:hypothetical protein